MKMKKIVGDCNLNTIKDGRGVIFSYIPKKDYVIDKMDFALKNLRPDKLSNVLKSQLKILI